MAWVEQPRIYVVLLALTLALRSPTLFDAMYLVDEGYAGAIATDMLHGGTIYETAVDTRPPFLYYTYYLVFLIAGQNNLRAVHIVAIGFVFATALTVRRIGCLLEGSRTGGWAGVGYVLFSHAYLPRDTLAANVEIFTLLPLTLALLCFLTGTRHARPGWFVMSGLLCGVAVFYRQSSFLYLGAMAGHLGYAWRIAGTVTGKSAAGRGLLVMAGFLSGVGAMIGYHTLRGNWEEMFAWTWTIAMRYVNSETTLPFVLRRLLLVHGTFLLATGLLWYFGVRQTTACLRAAVHDRQPATAAWLLIAGWLATAYAELFIGWRFPGHYHLMLMPPLAIMAGKAFPAYLDRLSRRPAAQRRRMKRWLIGAAAAPVLGFLTMAYIIREQTLRFTPISDYVAAHTRPDDRIFVWGSAPHIYSFSNRRMAARFISGSHLLGMYASRPHKDIDETKFIVPGSWDMLDADLTAHPPELIIDMSPISANWEPHPMARYPILTAHLKAYRQETIVAGAPIYRRTGS